MRLVIIVNILDQKAEIKRKKVLTYENTDFLMEDKSYQWLWKQNISNRKADTIKRNQNINS